MSECSGHNRALRASGGVASKAVEAAAPVVQKTLTDAVPEVSVASNARTGYSLADLVLGAR